MVRVNLVDPSKLSDQHLIAEYDEILMLVAYIKKYPTLEGIPDNYCLGKGHMKFFKDKIKYLKKRHELLKKEMKKRGFATNKSINLKEYLFSNKKDWTPQKKDFTVIKKRILEKIRNKPNYYRYYREKKNYNFFKELIQN